MSARPRRVSPRPRPALPESNGQITHRRKRGAANQGCLEPLRPAGWDAISADLIASRGNRCEITGLTERDMYLQTGTETPEERELREALGDVPTGDIQVARGITHYRVQACHLDHDPLNCRPENIVAAVAQWHGAYDYYQHRGQRMCAYAAQGRLTMRDRDETIRLIEGRMRFPEPTQFELSHPAHSTVDWRDQQPLSPGELEFMTMLALYHCQSATPQRLLKLAGRRIGLSLSQHHGGGIMRALGHLELRGLAYQGNDGAWHAARESCTLPPKVQERPATIQIVDEGWPK
ncbi:hypothetical protein [Deinococcus fonticola]|uniref:hypothetical protein n=1 Tax=Deinococcus fonticola TaxID=2528713 RepID=UPI0010756496|nr:hypothetical protein [Deinococcus fonticola]